jgi:hypothetical protein
MITHYITTTSKTTWQRELQHIRRIRQRRNKSCINNASRDSDEEAEHEEILGVSLWRVNRLSLKKK